MNRLKARKKSAKDYNANYSSSASSLVSTSFTKAFKKGKKNQAVTPDETPEIDLQNALPSNDQFRTSLLLPNLSARFSMLREQNDPSSMLGKANDDSVLEPKRASKLNFLDTSHSGLFDISEASSNKSPATLSFGQTEESVTNNENEDPNGSIMDRPRPLEGNVLFAGRQKVYRIVESSDPAKPRIRSKPLCEWHDVALHSEPRDQKDEGAAEENSVSDATDRRNHDDSSVYHQRIDQGPNYADPPNPRVQSNSSSERHDAALRLEGRIENDGRPKEESVQTVRDDINERNYGDSPVRHQKVEQDLKSTTLANPQVHNGSLSERHNTALRREEKTQSDEGPKEESARATRDATNRRNQNASVGSHQNVEVLKRADLADQRTQDDFRSEKHDGILPHETRTKKDEESKRGGPGDEGTEAAQHDTNRRSPVDAATPHPSSSAVKSNSGSNSSASDVSSQPQPRPAPGVEVTKPGVARPSTAAPQPEQSTKPKPLGTRKPFQAGIVPQNNVSSLLSKFQSLDNATKTNRPVPSKQRSSPMLKNNTIGREKSDVPKAPTGQSSLRTSQTDPSVTASTQPQPSRGDNTTSSSPASTPTSTSSVTNPHLNTVEDTSKKPESPKHDEPQAPPRNPVRSESVGQNPTQQANLRTPVSGIRRGSRSLRSPASEPHLFPRKEGTPRFSPHMSDPLRSKAFSKEVLRDFDKNRTLRPAPLNLSTNKDGTEPSLQQNSRVQGRTTNPVDHLQPPPHHPSKDNQIVEKAENGPQKVKQEASQSAVNLAGLISTRMRDDSQESVALPTNPPSPTLESHSVGCRSFVSDSTKTNPDSLDGRSQFGESVDQNYGISTPTAASEVSCTPPTRSPSRTRPPKTEGDFPTTMFTRAKQASDQTTGVKQDQQERHADYGEPGSSPSGHYPVRPSHEERSRSRHSRMESVEARIEREELLLDLAERRKIIHEKLKTVAQARSRSNSPAPGTRNTERTGSSPFAAMLRPKSQKASAISRENSPHRSITKFLGNEPSVPPFPNPDSRSASSRSRSSSLASRRAIPGQDISPMNQRDTNVLQPPSALPYARGRSGSEMSRARSQTPVGNDRPTTGISPRSFQRPSYESMSGSSSKSNSLPLPKKSHNRLRGNSYCGNKSVTSVTSVPAQQAQASSTTLPFVPRPGLSANLKRPVNKSQISEPVLVSSTGHIAAGISSPSSSNVSPPTPTRLRGRASANALETRNNNDSTNNLVPHPPSYFHDRR